MGISTHILDTSIGRPAEGVPVSLARREGESWVTLSAAESRTDADGRCRQLLPVGIAPQAGTYRVRFETGVYYEGQHLAGLYPYVEIVFEVRDVGAAAGEQHFHIPLLLTANGYTTYRGS